MFINYVPHATLISQGIRHCKELSSKYVTAQPHFITYMVIAGASNVTKIGLHCYFVTRTFVTESHPSTNKLINTHGDFLHRRQFAFENKRIVVLSLSHFRWNRIVAEPGSSVDVLVAFITRSAISICTSAFVATLIRRICIENVDVENYRIKFANAISKIESFVTSTKKKLLPDSMRESCSRFFSSRTIPFVLVVFIVAISGIRISFCKFTPIFADDRRFANLSEERVR